MIGLGNVNQLVVLETSCLNLFSHTLKIFCLAHLFDFVFLHVTRM
jgi:hypothetical protein